jgi:hypothetical protein
MLHAEGRCGDVRPGALALYEKKGHEAAIPFRDERAFVAFD